ncbi:MAG: acyltransferase family protein [Alcanivoracaceae bacterium]|jgi:peptidoglycan/LPS O-acetylase OafA/YrhL|nr:acyltransferase family protein [Alcanivoracaceae bacterium]
MLKYRAEIDGLRAVAVVPVILFHAGLGLFSGGYVGVDVFFVISGYLITSIILGEQQNGRFSLSGFYERRARRILPALFAVVFACLPFAWLLLTPDELRSFSRSIIGVSTFTSNFHFWGESGYFDTDAELKPLLHTWSLAVEEQYYILFPLLLMFLHRFGRKAIPAILIVLALASFALAELGAVYQSAAAFFLLPARAWELLAGSLCALYLRRTPEPLAGLAGLQSTLALTGLGMILASVVLLDGDTPFPGVYAVPTIVGTVLVICFAHSGNLGGRLLALRPVVLAGLISYSAYLWHHPLFAFTRHAHTGEPDELVMIGLAMLSMLLAYLSWRFVEAPFRDRKRFCRKQIWKFSGYGILLFIVIGLVGYAAEGFPERLTEKQRIIYEISRDNASRVRACREFLPEKGLRYDQCVPKGDFDARVLVFGDSHANALVRGLDKLLDSGRIGVTQFTNSACQPIAGVSRDGRVDRCSLLNDAILDYVLGDGPEQIIVMAGRWPLAFEGSRFDNGEGGLEKGRSAAAYPLGEDSRMDEVARRQSVAEKVHEQVNALLSSGKHVVLVYPVPEAGWHVPNLMLKHGMEEFPPDFASTRHQRFVERAGPVMAVLDDIGEHPRLHRVRPHEWLCDHDVPGRCITQREGIPLYKDDHHLSLHGSVEVAERIRDIVTSVIATQ